MNEDDIEQLTVYDAVDALVDDDALRFRETIHDLLIQKVDQALSLEREALSRNYFNSILGINDDNSEEDME